MSEQTCIVVGAGHAGVSLALQLRREGWTGGIRLIGAEQELPYHRPPLSKEYLAGEKELDAMRLRPARLFEDQGIDLLLGKTVLRINRNSKTLMLDDGTEPAYNKLALCTGSLVRTLPPGRDLSQIFYVRTAADAAAVRPHVVKGNRAVIIGAGYIGLEVAAVLAKSGLTVTVIEMAPRILQRVTSEPMSDYIQRLHENHGVAIRTSLRVSAIAGAGEVARVTCDDGSEFEADFIIAGIGVTPYIALAEQAGLTVDEGILIDQYTCTSDADIYAAGDCTRHPSPIYGRLLRLESVQNANDQARIAAANICGRRVPYAAVPWFWSDQYDIKLQMAGISEGYEQLLCRGDPEQAKDSGFALFYLKDSRLIAADCVGRPAEFMASKKLIGDRTLVDPSRLQDESIKPADFAA